MKAIRVHQFGGPEVMKLEEIPQPQLQPDLVLVQLRAIGVNPVDTYFRSGSNPNITLPWTPGLDAAGVVEATGTNVLHVKPGDRVYTASTVSGAYAQYAICTSEQVHRLPDSVSFQQGAGINVPYATAYRALFHRARAEAGETLLVHGASGGVGTAALQLARAAGLKMIGTAGSDAGLKLVLEQGAHHAVNHRQPDYLQQIMALTQGRGVDVILEMLANVNLAKDLTLLAQNGRVVVIGSRGNIEITPRETMSRDADIRGMTLFNVKGKDLVSIHAALGAGLENGTLRPIVGKEMPLAEAPRAHVAVLEPGAYGKIVLLP